LCWTLLLEENGAAFYYLSRKENDVADALSQLDFDSLKNQEETEKTLTLILGSESSSSISNIKLIIKMHTPLIFKEQA
jgi:hypothetical protein